MRTAGQTISDIDQVICQNIDLFAANQRGLLSQNILAQLRNLLDHVALKIYADAKGVELTGKYDNIQDAHKYIQQKARYKLVCDFFKFLKISTSHYTVDPDSSERLMLKYYEYLIKLKHFMKKECGMDILENIDRFPLSQDQCLMEYYEKIARHIDNPDRKVSNTFNDRYYIHKVRPFFVNNEVYYEVTFTNAIDNVSKFDRHIAFTRQELLSNYAVKLQICNTSIDVLGKKMSIMLIENWNVSIRPCEFFNFSKIFGNNIKFGSNNEVVNLMSFMTSERLDLNDIIDMSSERFDQCRTQLTAQSKKLYFWPILERCRRMSMEKVPGHNIIRYLLCKMNNKIIKTQYSPESNNLLSGLCLKNGVKPFDDMPFNSSPIGHNPKIDDIFKCIDPEGREHELLARRLKVNTENYGTLYTPIGDLDFHDTPRLMKEYNDGLYYKHRPRRDIQEYKKHLYINEYEDDCMNVLRILKQYSITGVSNFCNSVDTWLRNTAYNIDCDEKREVLRNIFASSQVALIYGAAGTGKSTLINHISNFFRDKTKLYLANTNPAVGNLRRKVNVSNAVFKTIYGFLNNASPVDVSCDVLFIDECSTVSNSDMVKVLNTVKTKLIVLVGDVYQIESIQFGNWFHLARKSLDGKACFELINPYRTNNDDLLTLWKKARELSPDLLEHIAANKYSETLDDSIFDSNDNDEIILCLNYDGLYGINNMNHFLQDGNPNNPIYWGIETYKVDDPILFNESNRFAPVIYNNLKGRIAGIQVTPEIITFDVEVYDVSINGLDAENYGFELLENSASGNAVIRFSVNRLKSTDDDDNSLDTVVPFQVAYAISIHKAQGLEYKSVKVVITDEVEERISHNILYTAITRAKESLKIYWTPETEKKVLDKLRVGFNQKDYQLLRSHYPNVSI